MRLAICESWGIHSGRRRHAETTAFFELSQCDGSKYEMTQRCYALGLADRISQSGRVAKGIDPLDGIKEYVT